MFEGTFSLGVAQVQSILVISKSKGLSEILRDIHTSTYQTCRIEEKTKKTTTFHKLICNLTPKVRVTQKILRKRRNCFLGAISPLYDNILSPVARFPC